MDNTSPQQPIPPTPPSPSSNPSSETKKKQQNTTQIVAFELDKEEFAIPVSSVREVIKVPEITPIPNSPDYIAGFVNVRGNVLSVVDLEKRFALAHSDKTVVSKKIVVVDAPDAPFGVLVDEVTEVLNIPANAIQKAPSTAATKIDDYCIRGVVVLEEGQQEAAQEVPEQNAQEPSRSVQNTQQSRALLLLDLTELLSRSDASVKTPTQPTPETHQAPVEKPSPTATPTAPQQEPPVENTQQTQKIEHKSEGGEGI